MRFAEHDDQQASDIIRLLLLTGARRWEVLSARWNQFRSGKRYLDETRRDDKAKDVASCATIGAARMLLAELRDKADEGENTCSPVAAFPTLST